MTFTIFATPSTYTLGKQLGIEAAGAEFMDQIRNPARADEPAAKMVIRMMHSTNVTLWHGWSTELAKLRSRAAHAALQSGCDQWVTIDDDVECDTSTLKTLLDMAGRDRIAVLPCLIRGSAAEAQSINVVFEHSLAVPSPGGPAYAVKRGGTGFMVVGRGALQRLCEAYAGTLTWLDDDGVEKVGLFEQRIRDRQWFGEDYSFCQRARAIEIEILAPTKGRSVHDGRLLDIASIEVRP